MYAYNHSEIVIRIDCSYLISFEITVNGESFAGLNFRAFDPMKYFAKILSRFIGQECSQL